MQQCRSSVQIVFHSCSTVFGRVSESSQYGYKLKKGKFRSDSRKEFFSVRVVRHWNRSCEAVAVPSLAVIKAKLDGALNKLL